MRDIRCFSKLGSTTVAVDVENHVRCVDTKVVTASPGREGTVAAFATLWHTESSNVDTPGC